MIRTTRHLAILAAAMLTPVLTFAQQTLTDEELMVLTSAWALYSR